MFISTICIYKAGIKKQPAKVRTLSKQCHFDLLPFEYDYQSIGKSSVNKGGQGQGSLNKVRQPHSIVTDK